MVALSALERVRESLRGAELKLELELELWDWRWQSRISYRSRHHLLLIKAGGEVTVGTRQHCRSH
jgi:hypothetical protein